MELTVFFQFIVCLLIVHTNTLFLSLHIYVTDFYHFIIRQRDSQEEPPPARKLRRKT